MLDEICRLCLDGNLEGPVCIYPPASLCRSQTTIAQFIENLINIKVNTAVNFIYINASLQINIICRYPIATNYLQISATVAMIL